MKIVQINSTYGSADSTGRNTQEMHLWFEQHGYSSEVWTGIINDASEADEHIHIFSSTVDRKIHALLSRITGLQGYFSRRATRKLIHHLKREKELYVVLGVLHSNIINFPLLFKFFIKHDVPVILVLHDCWFFTGHCCYYSEYGCNEWKDGCLQCKHMSDWNESWIFNTAAKCLNDKKKWYEKVTRMGVVAVSDWLCGEAKSSILARTFEIKRIYNWIDMEIFKPYPVQDLRKSLGLSDDSHIMIGVASLWSDKKGLKEILEVAKKFPDASILLIGQMPEGVECPENIAVVGVVKEPQLLAQYYALADVFLNPSVQETFGKTTAEAICCGTPVVAYDTTACTELVGTGRGVLVPLGDADAFMCAIQEILSRGKDTYTANCLEFAKKNFSKELNIQEYIELMNRLSHNNET